jgi:acetyl-CoA C-acetyltransferase
MRDVHIIGIGMVDFGELWTSSLRSLWAGAALAALDDAGVSEVDLITVGCMSPGLFVGQEHLASLLADEIGMAGVPAARVESACASGGLAVRAGFAEIAAGLADVVLVTGVEKMTDVDGADATFALGTAADQEWEGFHGITFPGLYAMLARAHMERYGTTREQLAAVAVKNHQHGLKNPHAQFHLDIDTAAVLESTLVADPLRLLDCSPVTDGATALVLASAERAAELRTGGPHVRISGSGMATDTISLAGRSDLTELAAVRRAAERAYAMANMKPDDIDLAEVHDCFTIAEIMAIEACGFVEPGRGGPATEAGDTRIGGRLPVNPSGGLKAKGHPVGATGVAQVAEIALQLRGEAADRQVEGARTGLAQNMGGSGGSSIVHILEVV